MTVTLALQAEPPHGPKARKAVLADCTRGGVRKGYPLSPHPSGVGRLHTGRCTKGGAADPDRTVTLVNKRNLRVI
ncbi:MAG: hypothetical protein LBK25_08055, partial [Treponema sp.]|nr:hypothetical protein [Treponema sp.]